MPDQLGPRNLIIRVRLRARSRMKNRKNANYRIIFLLMFTIAGVLVFTNSPGTRPESVAAQTGTQQGDLTAEERRGRDIYFTGESGPDNITATVRSADIDVPASTFTCFSCHGWYGEGRDEGGVSSGNITWSYLSRLVVDKGPGRMHPAYTEKTLENAIARGVDPGGNQLQTLMPKYRMTPQQMSDLIAFLKRIDTLPPPLWGMWQVTAGEGDNVFTFYVALELEDKIGGETMYADWNRVTGRKVNAAGYPEGSDSQHVIGAWKDGMLRLVIEDEKGQMMMQGKLENRKLSGDYAREGGKVIGKWVAVRQ